MVESGLVDNVFSRAAGERVLRVGPVTSVVPALVAALARAADAHSGGTGAAGELAEAVLCDALGTGLIASLLAEASETRRGERPGEITNAGLRGRTMSVAEATRKQRSSY